MVELYKKWRPSKFSEVVGQPDAVRMLQSFLKNETLPHTLLLTGGSGTGKTTIARIIKSRLKCGEMDFHEMNCAKERGIEMVRDIGMRMSIHPSGGDCRIWLMDECHAISRDGQSSLLKILEDTPSHVYFILATTDPQKLLPTIKTRCATIQLKPLTDEILTALIQSVLLAEKKKVNEKVVKEIIRSSFGSARQALVELDKIIDLPGEEEQLATITAPTMVSDSFEIVKGLLYEKLKWPDVAKILANVDLSEPERLRHFILACARTEIRKANRNAGRAALILEIFRDPWYDEKESGLERCCYAVVRDQ